MSYELSFAPEFFYDGVENKSKKPHTVYQALKSMSKADWRAMCEGVFPGVPVDYVNLDMVMDKVRETNSCSSLSVPVEVWIDSEGWHTVKVYDEDPRREREPDCLNKGEQ